MYNIWLLWRSHLLKNTMFNIKNTFRLSAMFFQMIIRSKNSDTTYIDIINLEFFTLDICIVF